MQIRDVIFSKILEYMTADQNVYVLTADMGAWGLDKIRDTFPARVFNVGIAEQNLINVATGMALMGKKVFAYGIAAFISYRCIDQIRVNLSGMCLPVAIIGTGADMTYKGDGLTHYSIYDERMISLLPNMIVKTPKDNVEAEEFIRAAYVSENPYYIRMAR